MTDYDLTEMSLAELFAASDAIGDRYLSEEEIDERAAILQAAEEEVDAAE